MDQLSIIKNPIAEELEVFIRAFDEALSHQDGLLQVVLHHIRQRAGKRMRPILTLLIAKNYGRVNDSTISAAVGLELLHTASLVHDDVVDESNQRRGQESVNAEYGNKVAVLVGDFILSTALLSVSRTRISAIVDTLAELGRTLSNGEILQLTNIRSEDFDIAAYYRVIRQKTAALFEACTTVGALSVGASEEAIRKAAKFGDDLGMIFQIRDDIFDYYDDNVGKPTANDMREGKLTLPVLHVLNATEDEAMQDVGRKVRAGNATEEEIQQLVAFTKANGGIEYAEKRMWEIHADCMHYLDTDVKDDGIRQALKAYLDYVIQRKK